MTLKKYMKLYMTFFKCSLMSEIEYRLNFVLRSTIELSYLITGIVFFDIIYSNVDSIAGWSKNDMYLLIILASLLDSLITLLFHAGLEEIPTHINQGTLDFILLKPINKRFYISCRKLLTPQLINIVINFGVLCYLMFLNSSITVFLMIMFLALLTNGVLILYNIFFFISIMSFWTIKIDAGVSIFYQFFNIGNKPLSIFPDILKVILVYIVPIFICFNFPILYIKNNLSIYMILIAFSLNIILFLITKVVFKNALNKYSSANS